MIVENCTVVPFRRVVGAIVEHSVSSPRGDLVPAYLRSLMERYAQQLPAYLTVVHCEVVNVSVFDLMEIRQIVAMYDV